MSARPRKGPEVCTNCVLLWDFAADPKANTIDGGTSRNTNNNNRASPANETTETNDRHLWSRYRNATMSLASISNKLRSPWREEITGTRSGGSSSNEDDDQAIPKTSRPPWTPDGPRRRRRPGLEFGNTPRRNSLNTSHGMKGTGSVQGARNNNQRVKWSTTIGKIRRSQKYHWSGTFNDRVKRYQFTSDTTTTTTTRHWRQTPGRQPSGRINQEVDTPSYNNLDSFDEKKPLARTKLFASQEDLNIRGNPDDSNNSLSAFHHDLPKDDEPGDHDRNNPSDRAGLFATARNVLCAAAKLILTFLKNLLLFSLLPTLYVAFFVYVQGNEKD